MSQSSERDCKNCLAEETCTSEVHGAMSNLDDLSKKLFEIPWALISLDDPDKVRSQEGDKIYAAISISD